MSKFTVVNRVVDSIISQVISGRLAPGDRLPTEPELCEQLGAGRNSVREAIKQLEACGVVHIRRADGTYINEHYDQRLLDPVLYQLILHKESFGDFLQLRRIVATGILHALVQMPQPDLAPIRKALAALKAELWRDAPDPEIVQKLDCDFHLSITQALNNPPLSQMCEYFTRVTLPARKGTIGDMLRAQAHEGFYLLHQQLFDVIERKDKSQIDYVLDRHYVHWKDALIPSAQ